MFFKEFELPAPPVFPETEVKIEGESRDITNEINSALRSLSARGGGRVTVCAGEWRSSAIRLQSNTELRFEEGANVTFSDKPEDYLPPVLVNVEGIRCRNYSPLIYGIDLENAALTGKGTLNGNGAGWWQWKNNMKGMHSLYHSYKTPVEERVYAAEDWGIRPEFIQISRSKNILIEGLTLINSPFWTVHPVWCDNVTVRKLTIENPCDSPNTDGINIDACRGSLVEDCTIVSGGDDMFCLKSGRNEDAWQVGRSCENAVIRRCKGLNRSQSGGIVFGSEMSGDIRNVIAEDCEFGNNINCIRLKSKDGRGGVVENIYCKNIHMDKGTRGINLSFRYSCEASDAPEEPGKHLPTFRNICFENISCGEVDIGIAIDGIPNAKMENIVFKNIEMNAKTCLSADSVEGLFMENVTLRQIETPRE